MRIEKPNRRCGIKVEPVCFQRNSNLMKWGHVKQAAVAPVQRHVTATAKSTILTENSTIFNINNSGQVIRTNSRLSVLREVQDGIVGQFKNNDLGQQLAKVSSFSYIYNGNSFTNNYKCEDLLYGCGCDQASLLKSDSTPVAGLDVNVDACIREMNTSDASTVEDTASLENDAVDAGDILPDEPYTYLQGLNSENLMQFSQQSALQELMLSERNDIKPKIDTLPSLTDHDFGGYNFEMILIQPVKSPWVHSESLNKIYIRMHQTFNIDVVFKPKMPIQPLRLRAFLCFVKEVSEPVLRCQNHMIKDSIKDENVLRSILRCENPATEYCGHPEGKSIIDRMSVLVPLQMSASKDDKVVRQTTAFKFTCQNSCFGRRETSMIFCLETMNGEILGQRVLDLKICSCPKRDKMLDERHLPDGQGTKRKCEDEIDSVSSKKMFKNGELPFLVKEEESNQSTEESSDNTEEEFEVHRTNNGRYRLVVTCHTKEHLNQQLDALSDRSAGTMLREPKNARRHYNYSQKILSLKRRAKRLA